MYLLNSLVADEFARMYFRHVSAGHRLRVDGELFVAGVEWFGCSFGGRFFFAKVLVRGLAAIYSVESLDLVPA